MKSKLHIDMSTICQLWRMRKRERSIITELACRNWQDIASRSWALRIGYDYRFHQTTACYDSKDVPGNRKSRRNSRNDMTKVTYGQWKEFRGNQILKFFRNDLPMQQIQIAWAPYSPQELYYDQHCSSTIWRENCLLWVCRAPRTKTGWAKDVTVNLDTSLTRHEARLGKRCVGWCAGDKMPFVRVSREEICQPLWTTDPY